MDDNEFHLKSIRVGLAKHGSSLKNINFAAINLLELYNAI